MPNFSIENLTPKKEAFDLGDKVIYFRNAQDFDIQEFAAWRRLSTLMVEINRKRQKAETEEAHVRLTRKATIAAREIIALVLPEFPNDILDKYAVGKIDHLASICISVASGVFQQNAASPELQEMVLAKYPDLPEEFIATLSHGQCQRLLPENEPEPAKN